MTAVSHPLHTAMEMVLRAELDGTPLESILVSVPDGNVRFLKPKVFFEGMSYGIRGDVEVKPRYQVRISNIDMEKLP